ncbi:MAG TPA: hypothetical protein VGE75_07350, partial [Acidimicrobiales bacterium]
MSDNGGDHRLGPSDYTSGDGDYFGLFNTSGTNYELNLYNPNGTLKEEVDAQGTVFLLGTNYLFYVGDAWPGGNGTIIATSPSLDLSVNIPPLTVTEENPPTADVNAAVSCDAPGIPTVSTA